MAGQIRTMIDRIIEERSKGNPTLETTTRTKLIIKGIKPEAFDRKSPDDPQIIEKLRAIGAELGVRV